ncbi:MAG: protein kinase, partial [Planctomycetota bacterium]
MNSPSDPSKPGADASHASEADQAQSPGRDDGSADFSFDGVLRQGNPPSFSDASQMVSLDGDSFVSLDMGDTETSSVANDKPSDPETAPEQLGPYQLDRLIGTGGMGRVFLAQHSPMQRIVALKLLPVDRMQDPHAVQRFYDEVRAASRLLHPNIVTAFDAGESDGVHYLAMEYVDGQTLNRLISAKGPQPVGSASSIIRQAAMGLLHAHRAGIVHRDIKPANIIRAVDGTVKVLDLGLARISSLKFDDEAGPDQQINQVESKGRLVGTLAFMSPEQLERPDEVDSRSDIYSLGATLHYLLVGRPPFGGELMDMVYGHRHGEVPDLMELRDDVDLQFNHIFQRMMAKSPDERYASLDEVIDDLAEYIDQSDAPAWLAEYSGQQSSPATTYSGTTVGQTARVLGIEVGMFYAAAASATPLGEVRVLAAGPNQQRSMRMVIASDKKELLFGEPAVALRLTEPQRVAHCIPMYIGQTLVDRRMSGRLCPPEALLALILRRIRQNAWLSESSPDVVAINVPTSYDQLHRRSLLHAARMAGFKTVRMVDRATAAAQCVLYDRNADEADEASDDELIPLDPNVVPVDSVASGHTLYVGLSGQASEFALLRRDATRVEQVVSGGHWHTGTLAWQGQLVNLAAEAFVAKHKVDPRKTLARGSRLQVACEKAMNAFLLRPDLEVSIQIAGRTKTVRLKRDDWLSRCKHLLQRFRDDLQGLFDRSGVDPNSIDELILYGPVLKLREVQRIIDSVVPIHAKRHLLDRSDLARGAAACIAGELPGRGGMTVPPRSVTAQSIGIFVEDAKGRRRILPLIPKGTLLPARTNRRMKASASQSQMSLSLVESAGVDGQDWHALGRHTFPLPPAASHNRTRMIS